MSKKSVKMVTKRKIVQLIYKTGRPFRSREIAEKLGIAHKTARKHLLDLERIGILTAEAHHGKSAVFTKFYKPVPNSSLEKALERLEKFYNKQSAQDEEKNYFSVSKAEQITEKQDGSEQGKFDKVAEKTSFHDFYISGSHEFPNSEKNKERFAEKSVEEEKKDNLEILLLKLQDKKESLIEEIKQLGDKLLYEYMLAINPLKGDTRVYEKEFNKVYYVDFTNNEKEARYSVCSLRRHLNSLEKARYNNSPYHISIAFGEYFFSYHWELIEEISKKVFHWFVFDDTAEVVLYEKGFSFVNVILEKKRTDLGFAWMLDLSRFPRFAVEASPSAAIPLRATLLSMFRDLSFRSVTFLPLGVSSGQGLAVKPLRGRKNLVTWFGIDRSRRESKLLSFLDVSHLPSYNVTENVRNGFLGLLDRNAEETIRQTTSILGKIYVIDKDKYAAEILERLSIDFEKIPAHEALSELEVDNVLAEKLQERGINFKEEQERMVGLKKELEEVKDKIGSVEKALMIEESLDESLSREISL